MPCHAPFQWQKDLPLKKVSGIRHRGGRGCIVYNYKNYASYYSFLYILIKEEICYLQVREFHRLYAYR